MRRPRIVRARIAEGQRRAWAERHRAAAHAGFVSAFYAVAGSSGDKNVLRVLLDRVIETATPDELASGRWSGWQRAVRSPGRIGVTTTTAEVFAGSNLEDLETIRRAQTPADLLEEER